MASLSRDGGGSNEKAYKRAFQVCQSAAHNAPSRSGGREGPPPFKTSQIDGAKGTVGDVGSPVRLNKKGGFLPPF